MNPNAGFAEVTPTTKYAVEVSIDAYTWKEFGTFLDAHSAREAAYNIKRFFGWDARVVEIIFSRNVIYYT